MSHLDVPIHRLRARNCISQFRSKSSPSHLGTRKCIPTYLLSQGYTRIREMARVGTQFSRNAGRVTTHCIDGNGDEYIHYAFETSSLYWQSFSLRFRGHCNYEASDVGYGQTSYSGKGRRVDLCNCDIAMGKISGMRLGLVRSAEKCMILEMSQGPLLNSSLHGMKRQPIDYQMKTSFPTAVHPFFKRQFTRSEILVQQAILSDSDSTVE